MGLKLGQIQLQYDVCITEHYCNWSEVKEYGITSERNLYHVSKGHHVLNYSETIVSSVCRFFFVRAMVSIPIIIKLYIKSVDL